jgi:hypothetical protein
MELRQFQPTDWDLFDWRKMSKNGSFLGGGGVFGGQKGGPPIAGETAFFATQIDFNGLRGCRQDNGNCSCISILADTNILI